ncbi:MAG: hypothetical protein IID41_06910 [Planctomycetes bacterium]|nr:hypothetical protein [Planctomycetota bacterium]
MTDPREIRLTLRPVKRKADQPDAWYRLRGLLKVSLRRFGWRCVKIETDQDGDGDVRRDNAL